MQSAVKKILHEVASESGVDYEEVEFVYFHFWRSLKETITSYSAPKIMLSKFGSFKPRLFLANRRIYKHLWWWKQGKSTRESIVGTIHKVWEVRKRLLMEKLGMHTYYFWRDVKTREEAKEANSLVWRYHRNPRKQEESPWQFKRRVHK